MAVILACWIYWGNQAIQTTTYEIATSKLEPGSQTITIVQISDLHDAFFGENQNILIEKIREKAPDLIAVTGDLIDSNRTDIGRAMEFIHGAVELAPVYYVTGNHEAWSGESYGELKQKLAGAGVNLMDGQSESISVKGREIRLLGVEDPSFSQRALYEGDEAAMDEAIGKLDYGSAEFTILLSHRPELFQCYADNKIDLALTGHAHGGQFRLPLIGGLAAPDQGVLPRYTSGVFRSGGTKMIVSRGLGNSIVPFRINNRPEIVVVRLKPEE